MGGGLGAAPGRVDGRRAVHDVVDDAVLRERRRVRLAPQAGGVGLVVAEQQLGTVGRVEVHDAELVVLGADDGRPSTRSMAGSAVCGWNVHVLRNHSVGSRWIGASSGPRLCTSMRQSRSCGSALA